MNQIHDPAAPFHVFGCDRPARWLVTCDHATNRVPDDIGDGSLGLAAADMNRHIAYDVGARGVAVALGAALDAPVICSNFSRLVIDPNRGEDDPTLLMKLYDGTLIPANRHADAAEVERRLAAYHRPYHAALAEMAARQADTVIFSVHSFTQQLNGRAARPWPVAILFAQDQRLSDPLIAQLQGEGDLHVGVNEPYNGDLPGDAIDRHALIPNRLNALIEIRNDLIKTHDEQTAWATRLAPLMTQALAETGL